MLPVGGENYATSFLGDVGEHIPEIASCIGVHASRGFILDTNLCMTDKQTNKQTNKQTDRQEDDRQLTNMTMGGFPTNAMAVLNFLLFPPLQQTTTQEVNSGSSHDP